MANCLFCMENSVYSNKGVATINMIDVKKIGECINYFFSLSITLLLPEMVMFVSNSISDICENHPIPFPSSPTNRTNFRGMR